MLYNMATMLASIATGYDVRVSSNVSPIHPRLQPHNRYVDDGIEFIDNNGEDSDDGGGRAAHHHHHHLERGVFINNTYHGTTIGQR